MLTPRSYHNPRVLLVVLLLILVSAWIVTNWNTIVSGTPQDWPMANNDYSSTRAAVGSSIRASNVSRLGVAWVFPISGVSEWGAAATNPLIVGSRVYFQDLKSNVYSLDFRTGQNVWTKQYNLDNIGPNGVAIGGDKIVVTKGHYDIAALDLNGNEIWTRKLSDSPDVGIDIQPAVLGNTIYTCTVPGVANKNFYKGGSIGLIFALDLNTGSTKWSFDTVDSKNIWGNPKVNSGGGCWYPPSIDTKTNVVYFGIGNPAPWPGTPQFPNGTSRPGNNLYSSSVVALNGDDGKLIWYNQFRAHDLFDYDAQISPILTSITTNGKTQEVVFGSGKMGRVFAIDRSTGKTIWQTAVGLHQNDTLEKLPTGVTPVAPGPLGGVETVMAYSDGVLYVPVVDLPVTYKPTELITTSLNLGQGKGRLVAINAANGQVIWDKQLPSVNVGAATVVNNLVFTSTFDGKIYAFNRATGEQVWSFQAPGGINGWPAVKGDTIIFPVGLGTKPMLIAFRIGATGALPTTAPMPTPAPGKTFQQ